jgi:hypothetical protein
MALGHPCREPDRAAVEATSDIHLPIWSDSVVLKDKSYLEWGQEMSRLARTPTTGVQNLVVGGIGYSFSCDSVPRKLVVTRGKDTLASYVYASCELSRFAPPKDVDFSKSAQQDLEMIFKDWTRPVDKKRIPSCKSNGVCADFRQASFFSRNNALPVAGSSS